MKKPRRSRGKACVCNRTQVMLNAYDNLPNYALALQRFDETRQIIHEAQARKMDNDDSTPHLYALAFLGADSAAMAEQQQWFAGRPDYESDGLALASDTEAYGGHLGKARELTKRAVDSAIRADSKENGADMAGESLLSGKPLTAIAAEARQDGGRGFEACSRESGRRGRSRACVCHGGRYGASRIFGTGLRETLPAGHPDAVALAACDSGAIGAGQKEPGSSPECPASCFAHRVRANSVRQQYFLPLSDVYVRGEAYLAAGQGSAAAAEFQKILDHSGIVWNCWTGALARLGVARANALQSRTSQGADADAARVRALAAYKDFLTLWKDADPDIPILKQAKAEYAKLQ